MLTFFALFVYILNILEYNLITKKVTRIGDIVKILYKNKTAEKQFSPEHRKKWRYPKAVEVKLLSIENAIRSAETLYDIVNYPPYHFHRLEADRKEEWSIYVGHTGYRVTLIPCDDDENPITDGDIIGKCRVIKIVMVTEVSNHYE